MAAIQKAREALRAIIDTLDAEEMGEGPPASEHVAHWQKLHDDGTAALAALDAETEVKVRELEWVEGKATYPFYTASALTLFYVIRTGGAAMDGQFSVDVDGRSLKPGGFETLEAAKAAAQADFERRIRSALVTPEARS